MDLLDNVASRLESVVQRAVLLLTKNNNGMQTVQVGRVAADAPTEDDVELWEPYGFTSRPKKGAEALVIHLGADEEVPVVLAVADRRYRLKGLAEGSVAIYNNAGHAVVLTASGVHLGGASASLGVARLNDGVQVTVPSQTVPISVDPTTHIGTVTIPEQVATGLIIEASSEVFSK